MRENDFKELMNLKRQYKELKYTKLKKQRALREYQTQVQEKANKLQTALDFKRNNMLGDKEQRDSYGITNQQMWGKKIKELTLDEEENIQQLRSQSQKKIEGYERDIEDLTLKISDLHWELTIKLEHYKDAHHFNPQIKCRSLEPNPFT